MKYLIGVIFFITILSLIGYSRAQIKSVEEQIKEAREEVELARFNQLNAEKIVELANLEATKLRIRVNQLEQKLQNCENK